VSELVRFEGDAYATDDKNRCCQELQCHIVREFTEEFHELSYEWSGLKTVGVVMSFRSEGYKAPAEPMIRYYISSAELSAKKLAEAARQYWYIEKNCTRPWMSHFVNTPVKSIVVMPPRTSQE
jgi:hypothetical protein